MSSSSRVRLTRLRESTYGVLPTPAAMKVVRRTGGSFSANNVANPSDEVRSDLQVTDVAREDRSAKGTIEDEWVFAAHDEEIQDAMGSTATAAIALTGLTLTFDESSSTIERSSGSFISDGIVAGGVYRSGEAINDENNCVFRVVTVDSATVLTVVSLTTANLVDEVATADCIIDQDGHWRLGTNRYSSIFEELFADISSTELEQYLGMCCTEWNWSFDHPGKIKTVFNYEGSNGGYTASTAGNGTVTAYATNRVMNTVDHWLAFREGGASAALVIKTFNFKLGAPKRRISGAGTLGNSDMGMNTFSLGGSLKVYNSAVARAAGVKASDFSDSSLEWITRDSAGNLYHFYVPAINYSDGSPEAGAKDGDVYRTLNWMAKYSSTIGGMFQVTKIAA